MVEINPFVQDAFGHAVVLDAKVNFDDNALQRQTVVAEKRDYSQV
jgi:succinyl-CoA synthetase beta subunit